MYSWGGSTNNWKGSKSYDFGSARARYDKTVAADPSLANRTYKKSSVPNMDLVDALGKTIKSDSKNPIIIGVDVTGSMSDWPAEIFDRLPLLYQTLAKYRPDADFCFCAIGDANSDHYPLQINDFANKPKDLEAKLNALGCEGGGGGQIKESYELFAYHMLNHCQLTNATSPFLIIYGDEAFYDKVNKKQVKHYIGDKIEDDIDSKNIWQSLLQKFDLYYLQKPYDSGDSIITKDVKKTWSNAIGAQRIIDLPSCDRAVDIAMGLIAKKWGEYTDFGKSLDARHDDDSLKKSVHKSLRFIDAAPSPASVVSRSKKSKLTKSLLD
ncbi:MAG: hypothetical protein ACP5OG_01280 [Candidatus Nanoarchaeia archaeon]